LTKEKNVVITNLSLINHVYRCITQP